MIVVWDRIAVPKFIPRVAEPFVGAHLSSFCSAKTF
jgi:hypothetical protein